MALDFSYEPSGATGSGETVNVSCNWTVGTSTLVVLAERQSDGAQATLTSTGSNPPGAGAYYRSGNTIACGNPWSGSAATFWVYRLSSPTQDYDPRNNSGTNVRALAAQLDRTVAAVQELQALVSGKASASFDAQVITSFDAFRLAGKVARAEKFLRFDENGDPTYDDTITQDMLDELTALDALAPGIVKKIGNALYTPLDSSTQGELILNLSSSDGIHAVAHNGDGVSLLDVGAKGIFILAADTAEEVQALIDLVPGEDVQAYDADLAALAALASTGTVQRTGAGAFSTYTVSDYGKSLIDDASASAARDTLELGTLAVEDAASVGADLVPATNITYDIGSEDHQWAEIHALSYYGQDVELTGTIEAPLIATDFLNVNASGALVVNSGVSVSIQSSLDFADGVALRFEGTADAHETTITVADPTADRSIVFPDASGTVALVGGSGVGDIAGPASATDNAITRFDGTTGKLLQNSTCTINDSGDLVVGRHLTVTGNLNGTLNLFATLQDAIPLVFEGATVNSFKTRLNVTDPTATRDIVLPDASGTVVLSESSPTFEDVTATGTLVAGIISTTGAVNVGTTLNVGVSENTTGSIVLDNQTTAYSATLRASGITSSNKTHELPDVSGTIVVQDGVGVVALHAGATPEIDLHDDGNSTFGGIYVDGTGLRLYFDDGGTPVDVAVTESGALQAGNGSASAPTWTFASDPDCGLYRSGTNQIALAANGANKLIIDNGYVASQVQFFTAAGSASLPGYTFNGDSNTGIYWVGADQVGFATNGTLRMRLDDNGLWYFKQLYAVSGSASFPGQSFADDTDTGWYRAGADQLGGACGGTQRFLLTSTGINNTAIGVTTRGVGYFTTIKGRRELSAIVASGTLPASDNTVYRVTVASSPLTLPASPNDGDTVTIIVSHATPTGTQIFPGAGTLILDADLGLVDGDVPMWLYTSTRYGSVTLVYDTSDGAWIVVEKTGTWAADA